MRMSSGPTALTSSVRATTWVGSRRSMPTILSRWIQSAESSMAEKRRTASRGKRVVIVVWAPSRSRRSAMYMPIFARPPVSRARLPVRSVRAVRAELVVEGVDERVALLADVAGTGDEQFPGDRCVGRAGEFVALRLVVD